MLQTNVKRSLIRAAIVIGLSFLIGGGGSYLLSGRITGTSKAIAAAKISAARTATLGPRLAALQEQEASAATYARLISLLLPTQEQLLEVPRQFEQLGRTHGVTVAFQFQDSPPPGAAPPGASLPFSLTVSGPIANIQSFLADIEIKNPRYTIRLNGLEVSVAGDGDGSRVSTGGDLYYQ